MIILNVLHLPWFAGTEQMYVNYTEAMIELGHKVICLVPENAEVLKYLPKSKNIKIIQDNSILMTRGKWNLSAILRFRRLCISSDVDCVFCHSGGSVKLFKKVLLFLNQIKIIGVCHGNNVNNIIKADYVVSMNSIMSQKMIAYGKARECIFDIPNYVNLKDTVLHTSKRDDEFVIGTMCRLEADKKVEDLISAFAQFNKLVAHSKLIIGGEGELSGELEYMVVEYNISDKVEFCGWVTDKRSFFNRLDVFCLPSIYETFGLVILEAMYYNTPVIAATSDGAKEIIADNVNGLLYEKGDVSSLVNMMDLFYSMNDSEVNSIITSANDVVQQKFSRYVFLKNLSAMLNKIS